MSLAAAVEQSYIVALHGIVQLSLPNYNFKQAIIKTYKTNQLLWDVMNSSEAQLIALNISLAALLVILHRLHNNIEKLFHVKYE